MAVNRTITAKFGFVGNVPGALPVDEFLFDGLAVGMVADCTFALVALEILLGLDCGGPSICLATWLRLAGRASWLELADPFRHSNSSLI